jgi:hypothetical protein
MVLSVVFYHPPKLGGKLADRLLKEACLQSPSLLKEALASVAVGILAAIGFLGSFAAIIVRFLIFKFVDWRVYILVEPQCMFNLQSLAYVDK